MKPLAASALLALLLSASVCADWDPELEKQEEANRIAEQQAQAQREAEAEAVRVNAMRQVLGADASGHSDAEVRRLYNERYDPKRMQAQALAQQAKANREVQQAIAPNKAQVDAATRAMTGKTIEEMQNMSEAELEAMARAMEQKYGQ